MKPVDLTQQRRGQRLASASRVITRYGVNVKNENITTSESEMRPQLESRIPVSQTTEKPRLSLRPQLTQLAAKGCLEQLEALLEEGIDVDTPSPNGSTALVIAAKYGQLQAVNMLLKYGAKTHQEAITAATEAGHIEIVECIQNGAGAFSPR